MFQNVSIAVKSLFMNVLTQTRGMLCFDWTEKLRW